MDLTILLLGKLFPGNQLQVCLHSNHPQQQAVSQPVIETEL